MIYIKGDSVKCVLPRMKEEAPTQTDEFVLIQVLFQYQSIYDQCTNALGLMRSVLSNPIVGRDQDEQIGVQSALCAAAVMTICPIAEKVDRNLQEERAS